MRRFAIVPLLAALPCAAIRAQDAATLPEGALARVTLTRRATDAREWRRDAVRWRGTIEAATSDSFRLRLRDGREYTFAWNELARLERYLGRDRGHGASRGALLGAATGFAFFGAAALMGAATDDCLDCPVPEAVDVAASAVLGGVVGITLGAVLGAIAPGDQWARVRPPPRVGLVARPRAPGLAIAVDTR